MASRPNIWLAFRLPQPAGPVSARWRGVPQRWDPFAKQHRLRLSRAPNSRLQGQRARQRSFLCEHRNRQPGLRGSRGGHPEGGGQPLIESYRNLVLEREKGTWTVNAAPNPGSTNNVLGAIANVDGQLWAAGLYQSGGHRVSADHAPLTAGARPRPAAYHGRARR